MRVEVKFGTKVHVIEVPGDDAGTTLGQLKDLIREATGVLPAMQKLLGKPGLQNKPDDATLLSLGIKDKTKLMLIGSTAEDVVKANAPTNQAEKDAEDGQEKLMRSLPYNFWAFAPFAGLLGDPYVDGKGHPLEGGSSLMALLSLDVILSRINTLGASASNPFASSAKLLTVLGAEAGQQVSHRFLKDLPAAHRTAVQKAHAVLRTCFRFNMEAGEGKFPDNVLGAVDKCAQAIDSLPVGEWLMLPSGWLGMRSYNVMFLLLRKASPEVLDLVVVNKGNEGSEYHPKWATAEKLRSCAVLRFDRVSRERLMDRTFWLLHFALWMNRDDPGDRSEFVRAEVFYDVLLPWLVEKDPKNDKVRRYATEMLLQGGSSGSGSGSEASTGQANEEGDAEATEVVGSLPLAGPGTDAHHPFSAFVMAHGGSIPCSASSAIKSAVAAFCFLLEQYGGMSRSEIQQVKYALKYEYFLRAAEDLARCADRYLIGVDPARLSSTALSADQLQQLSAATAAMKASAGIDAAKANEKALTIQQVLAEAKKQNVVLKTAQNVILQPGHFDHKMVILYTGTLAVPGMKKFASLFADTAAAITRRVKDSVQAAGSTAPASSSPPSPVAAALPEVEFLMLSCDQTRETYEEHAAMFTFPRAAAPCLELFRALDIHQAPEVFVFMQDGTLLHRQGARAVREDPDAELFPGGPWRGTAPLSATDVKMLGIGAAQLAHHTTKRYDLHALSDEDVSHVVELLHAVQEVVEALPKDDVHTITKARDSKPQPTGEEDEKQQQQHALGLNATLANPISTKAAAEFNNADLLPTVSVAQYYGKPYRSSVPTLPDICNFTPATSYAELASILKRSKGIVETLWARASHSGTASRVAVQMHIVEFITWIFSTMVPVPLPSDHMADVDGAETAEMAVPVEERACVSAFYHLDSFPAAAGGGEAGDAEDAQMDMLDAIYYLMLSLANAWQAVENPSRSFDAERCLIAMDMLIVFDAIARHTRGAGKVQMLAMLLNTEGGYYPSTTLGKQATSFASVAASLELTRPALLPLRSAMLRYIQHQKDHLKHELFDLRMPDKLELRKGSTTVTFLRTFLDNCGYSLEESGSMMGQNASEMEKLMEWLCSARSPLAREHGEFALYRDMVLLAKFLGTLEMRDAQLLHRRKEMDPLASWRLSFEEDAPGRQMSAGWRTRPSPPKWECAMVRGRDMDIADLIVKGFGDREVMYGEGLTLQSPIDVSRLIEVDHPTEDDVLHAKSMPSFGGTMSPEESEVLLSCLTTPYVRIPLILDFFSSQDRNTYLFVPEVQETLRAVLFEPGAYVSPERLRMADPRSVPMRLNAQQRAEIELRILRGDHSRKDEEECLGTTYGLLLNEIVHAPTAVLQPLRRILESVSELGPSSVYSANASYVLYIVGVVCDVLAFCRFVVEKQLSAPSSTASQPLALVEEYHNYLVNYLHSHVAPLMHEWLCESEANADTPTQCVIYAYKSMIDRALWKGLLAVKSLAIFSSSSSAPGMRGLGGRPRESNPEAFHPVPSPSHQQQQQKLRAQEAERHLVSLLQDCSFVRARHGFGMGMQRTQLASQEGDDMLTPEEKMLRFLQAQGLDTSHVSRQMLEQGRQLMMSGGRRRAVFVQIRSRFYNDTVRVPNLFHSDPTSTTESKALKLPPADVPENIIFSYLLQDHLVITTFLDEQTPESRGAVFQKVVQAVLRDRGDDEDSEEESAGGGGFVRRRSSLNRSTSVSTRASAINLDQMGMTGDAGTAERWTVESPGVYRGPASSGLLFHVQTCELFWRNDELKPVPDSMSHFTDFENILGKEILQCGLVSRHEHRHWVHVVGTPYDIIEWSAPPDLADQGVHSPIVLEGELPAEPVMRCVFEGVTYDRPLAIDDENPWPVKEERWATEMVRQVLQRAFPGGMKFFPLAAAASPSSTLDGSDEAAPGEVKEMDQLRFIMNDAPQYDDEADRATWKEIVCYRYPQPHFDVFNLVPHARKMYRSLVFSTNQRYCLHSLALLSQQRTRESLTVAAYQAGELKRRVQRESTLEIHRFNEHVNGRETYLPARLLQGLIPSALLESFFFWQGEDDIIRGYPLSDESGDASVLTDSQQASSSSTSGKHTDQTDTDAGEKQKDKKKLQNTEMLDHWFNYAVEIHFGGGMGVGHERRHRDASGCGGTVTVVRREDKTYTPIRPRKPKAAADRGGVATATQQGGRGELSRLAACQAEPSGEPQEEEEEAEMQRAMRESEVSLLQAALSHLPLEVCAMVLSMHSGDIAAAIQWATDPANQVALTEMSQQTAAATASTTAAAPDAAAQATEAVERDDRLLVNLLRCKSLSVLLEMFTNLEDPSHIMVWGKAQASAQAQGEVAAATEAAADALLSVYDTGVGKWVTVESIELPRLRARFYTSTDGSSPRLRLYLADQPGWRVAEEDDFASDAHRAALRTLQDPFQQCLVLCNSTHDVALMVPNHDFTPMNVAGDPFNALLLFDRSSYTWRESVPSPYYLYTVHTSNAFLLPATLSASLYYGVMQCATQHYSGAMRTLESCYTDSPFSPEEAYMFALFERTVGDAFPDAHAVRLKLAHAVQYSKNEYQWSLPQELTGYLQKMRHVSADCRLKRAEVLDLLKRCTKAVPLVRSQLELYAGLLSHQHKSPLSAGGSGAGSADVTIKTPAMDRCGFPWERLLLYPWDKISPQKLKRVTYSTPQPDKLCDGKLVQFLFTDELLADEESGSNAKRGFYFLYSIKKGDLKPMLYGESVAVSFSQLMGRWFHLRHARWGREAQQTGETEMAPSWCATVLQLMEMFPSADWPAPVSVNERYMMARGVNLVPGSTAGMNWDEQREERRTTIPDMFNKMNSVARELFTTSSITASVRAARSASQLRTPDARSITVTMYDHIKSRVLSQNTAMGSVELKETSFLPEYFPGIPAVARSKTLAALCSEPLRELGFTSNGLITVIEPGTERGAEGKDKRPKHAPSAAAASLLPFNIRDHPLARAPLAQNMLDRLEEDSARFAEQQQGTTRYAFAALGPSHIHDILCGSGTTDVCASLAAATAALSQCEASLFALARRDAGTVARLTKSILAVANATHQASLTKAAKDAATARPPAQPAYLKHCLEMAHRGRVPVTMEWLCGGLLSSELEAELAAVNPFHGSTERLRAELVLLMLLSNRGFFAEQSALAVRNVSLFLECCQLLRNTPPVDHHGNHREDANDPHRMGATAVGGGGAGSKEAQRRRKRQRMLELVQHFSLEIQPQVLAELMAQQEARHGETGEAALIQLPEEVARMLQGRAQQLLSAALDLITAKRYYATVISSEPDNYTFELDPRFLLFEFLFNLLLRARQVEMVRWFVENIRAGQSRVQQMIMGQGKTTVVGPLLALILADGTQLVTQVMPTALLEQTRGILRRCFSVVVVKHIYTLQFDRSFDDGGDAESGGGVELMYQKLQSAEEDRSVVIAAPECIKSLFLKEIEQLHMIDTVSTEDLNQELSSDERYATHATALRKRTAARSTMADAITPILQLWKRGVLIMDEVDVLLHPLRSELNFPIGLKHPIDMTGHRWLLPIHLLDAIFYYQRGRACEDVQKLLRLATSSLAATANIGANPAAQNDASERQEQERHAALQGVRTAIAKGFASRSLQREPHLVLLDVGYYEKDLLPALVPWLQLWLHEQILERMSRTERERFVLSDYSTFCAHTTPFLLAAVKEDESSSPVAAYMNAHLSGFGIKLLNLAHDWLHRLLPHVLSKIDRVSFGVLQPNDLALTGGGSAEVERIPYSRRMMAVPFVAKDVPSRSSEFAHPDVVIGLTVLAFRYEGLRMKDVRELVTQLKQDFARQAGPKEHRPAAKLYRRWLQLSSAEREEAERAATAAAAQANGTAATAAAGATTPHKRLRRHMSVAALHEREGSSSSFIAGAAGEEPTPSFERAGVPLSQLQVTDKAQLISLHRILHRVPEVIHYYLCSCIFPRTMNFQNLKISACGHELGSSMLFTKRIGFSGTPSNLLPLDLGECFYEPGSDGRVLSVLTNPEVAHAEVLPDSWTPLKVLDRIAAAQPPLAALIDAGALITNMDNEDVARYLLQRLPPTLFDGVVFLDSRDRQMILQRDNGLIVPVAQCGVSLSRRFTFFDQVHTTGTDVKQSSTATAVITLGKDLVFRDYAQGAYRMRGIGKGQRLCLYLIPEVISRIHEVLGPFKTGDMLRDVPAWLLLNSMKVEGLQFFKLSLQELANVWRKKAIRNLMRDSVYANAHADLFNGYLRCRRFHLQRPISEVAATNEEEAPRTVAASGAGSKGKTESPAVATEFDDVADVTTLPDIPLLKCSIQEFRETIEYPVAARVEAPKPFLTHLQELVEERPQELIEGDAASQALVDQLLDRMRRSIQASRDAHASAAAAGSSEDGKGPAGGAGEHAHQTMDLNAEIVHEQEAEEEQEQEAEQEEQRISAFSRDDEFQVPWAVDTLRHCGTDASLTVRPTNGCCFFQLNSFQVRPSQPHLSVDPSVLLSDNYFRLDWHGVGERRLKTAFLFLEWIPDGRGVDPAAAAAGAKADRTGDICSGLVTLAEGESLRWLLHHSAHTRANLSAALRLVSTGRYMDASPLFSSVVHRGGVVALRHMPLDTSSSSSRSKAAVTNEEEDSLTLSSARARLTPEGVASSPDKAALLFRFFNNDMFYSDAQLQVLEHVLREVNPEDRLQFFVECLRVRRRHRNHWEDAPIAALFVSPDDRTHLRQLAVAKRMQLTFGEMLEVLVRAAKQKCSSATRKEAGQIQGHLEAFTLALTGASQSSTNEERPRSGSTPQRPVALPANQLALLLMESFPKAFQAFSNYDIEQALLFAVARSQPHGHASTPSGHEEEGGGRDGTTESKPIALAELLATFPLLDLQHVHECIERGSTTAVAPAPVAAASPATDAEVTATAAQAAEDAPWHCEVCTYLNEPSSRACAMCMSARPKAEGGASVSAAAAATHTGEEHDEDEDDVDGPWQCTTCTFINDSRALPVCAVCLANNPNPLREKTQANGTASPNPMMGDLSWDCPEGYWVCSVEHGGCSKFNPNSVFYCQVCEKARPNLASVRF